MDGSKISIKIMKVCHLLSVLFLPMIFLSLALAQEQEGFYLDRDDGYDSETDDDKSDIADGHHNGMASPEPSTSDPMMPTRPTIPVLYLSSAGKLPLTESRLASFSEVRVCADDFPTGWTVRCDVVSKPSVVFRVMGQIYKKEYRAPYYLSGNWRDRVGDFSVEGAEFLAKSKRLRISCRVRTRKAVWVDFVVGC